jgi:hypothetical protein
MLDPGYKVKIKRMDRRFTGYGKYTHHATIDVDHLMFGRNGRHHQFQILRVWCWENFGESCELGLINRMPHNPRWCWQTEHDKLQILLDNQAASLVAVVFS